MGAGPEGLSREWIINNLDDVPDLYKHRLDILSFLERNRYIPEQVSKEHYGFFDRNKIPYLNAVLEALEPEHPATHIALMKSVQSAATTSVAEGAMAYYIYYKLGGVLYLTSTKNVSRIRSSAAIDVMIDNTADLAEHLRPMSQRMKRKTADTTYYKEFSGGIQLLMTSYGSIGDLKSNPFVLIIRDEWAEAPAELKGQGATAGIIEGRTLAASSFKILSISTPSSAGSCQIYKSFLEGDQREYFVPCPHCGEYQHLVFKKHGQPHGLTFRTEKKDGAKILLPETVAYICKFCKREFLDAHRSEIMPLGEWRPCFRETKPKNDKHISFHVSGLMSPFLSWERICSEFMRSDYGNDLLALKNFMINLLGEPWRHIRQRASWEVFKAKADDYCLGEVPDGGLLLLGGVDVQQDRLELAVLAFGVGMEAWLVEYEVFMGDLQDVSSGAWAALADYCYSYAHSRLGRISLVAVDVGYNPQDGRLKDWGQKAHLVVSFVSSFFDLFVGVKGAPDTLKSALIQPTNMNSVKIYLLQTGILKEYLFENIAASSGPRALHFPKYRVLNGKKAELDDFIYQSFVSEDYREVKPGKMGWHKIFNRNELLDLVVYAHFCAHYLGVNRYSSEEWEVFRNTLNG